MPGTRPSPGMRGAVRLWPVWLFLLSAIVPAGEHGAKLLVGHLEVTGHAKLFVAKERGFFRDEGLDVELVAYSNSADGLAAVKANKLDVGAFGTVAPLVYIAAGADIRIIGGIMGEDAYLVALPEKAREMGGPADLRGKSVATVRLSSGNAVLLGALRKAGLAPNVDLTIIELSAPDAVLRAVEMKQADAGLIWGPFDIVAAEKGMVAVLATADLFPGHPCCRVVVTGERLAAKGRQWRGFLRAVLKAERFIRDPANREKTVVDIVKYVDIDPWLIERSYFHGRLEQASDPNVAGMLEIWNTMIESNFIDSDIDPGRFMVSDLFRDAVDSLIAEEPDEPYWPRVKAQFEERDRR